MALLIHLLGVFQKKAMTRYLTLGLFVLLALTFSCSKENLPEAETFAPLDYDTISLYDSMKGWELYSWPNADTWNFSLLPGTNRLKSYNEVMGSPIAVTGLEALQELFSHMPEESEIFLISEDWLSKIWDESYGVLRTPPLFVRKQIQEMGKQRRHHVWIGDE